MTLPGPAELRALARRDPRLGRAMKGLPPYPGFPEPSVRRMNGCEYLARAIVYQQISGAAARTIWRRACELTPGPRFPRPAEILALTPDELRAAGLSRGKQLALRDLAERSADGRLRPAGLARRTDEDVIETLSEVRGIGIWSAQMYLLFKLGRLDVMPAGDLGVQEGVRLLCELDERPKPAAMLELTAVWAPLRSVGTWFMWRLVHAARGEEPAPP